MIQTWWIAHLSDGKETLPFEARTKAHAMSKARVIARDYLPGVTVTSVEAHVPVVTSQPI